MKPGTGRAFSKASNTTTAVSLHKSAIGLGAYGGGALTNSGIGYDGYSQKSGFGGGLSAGGRGGGAGSQLFTYNANEDYNSSDIGVMFSNKNNKNNIDSSSYDINNNTKYT